MATRIWIATNNNDWGTAGNWSGGAVPTTGDDVVFENNNVDVNGSLDQNGETLASLTIRPTFIGKIGTPPANGVAGTPLKIGATAVSIGRPLGNAAAPGSPWINLDLDTDVTTVTIDSTCVNTAAPGLPPVNIIGVHTNNVVYVRKGSVGIAFATTGQAATLNTLNVGEYGQPDAGVSVKCGTGLTITTVKKQNGTMLLQSAATTVTNDGGELRTEGSGAITTINMNGGLLIPNSTGTITTLNCNADSVADFNRSLAPRTVTTTNGRGGSLRADNGAVTFTNPPSGKFGKGGGVFSGT